MVDISRTGPQGSVYRRGETNNTAESRGRNAGLGDSDWGSETTRREITRENIWKYEAGKGDPVVERGYSGNYRGIKLMCHSVKLYERVHDNRL